MRSILVLLLTLYVSLSRAFVPVKPAWRVTVPKPTRPSDLPPSLLFSPTTPSPRRTALAPLQFRFDLRFSLDQASLRSLSRSIFAYHGPIPVLQALFINALLFWLARPKLLSSLTPSGYTHALALGTCLWATTGWRGWSVCVLYLILGSMVTKVKFAEKQQRGLAEGRGGRRGPENVWGSAATGLFCAAQTTQLTPLFGISRSLFMVAYVASLATKLADTFASEIGKAYGKTTFLITTLKRVEPGTEGAVSAEGTAASVVGGFLLSYYAYYIGLINWPSVKLCTAAAFLATNVESILGATLQDKRGLGFMTNEVVNFINTLVGAVIAVVGGKLVFGMS